MLKILPDILCGPMIRRLNSHEFVVWLVTSRCVDLRVTASRESGIAQPEWLFSGQEENSSRLQIGTYAFVHTLTCSFETPLANDESFCYDLYVQGTQSKGLRETCAHVFLPGSQSLTVTYKPRIQSLLHGSCRKPHFASRDALVQVYQEMTQRDLEERPSLLMLAGDQVYVDDVAGPMLVAIHQIMALLGLFPETLTGCLVADTEALLAHPSCYYQRTELLPDESDNATLQTRFFAAKRKPIFTSVNAQNHLITAAEVFAMYLLSWSPVLWRWVDLHQHTVPDQFAELYQQERVDIQQFADDLPAVASVFAHLPTYMIFDDHDVTDDWNLTRAWEQAAYGHPFSRRIIGNALLGYWLFQGIGNHPAAFSPLLDKHSDFLGVEGWRDQDQLIDALLNWSHWHYSLNTEPKIVVLDTRTHRWRSEKGVHQPSGLMDWKALTAFQQELYGEDNVIVVSAAPVFGVKLIEAIQRVFTFFGKALMVDAENWMAHPGTAKVMLETFQDARTPNNLTILSGDVHYSFVYDVRLRSDKSHTHIVQVTCSGFKNAFPDTLLKTFDLLNRWLYNRWSMFNFFTKRRRMSIRHRLPNGKRRHTLYNDSAVSEISLDPQTKAVNITLLCQDGKRVVFEKPPPSLHRKRLP